MPRINKTKRVLSPSPDVEEPEQKKARDESAQGDTPPTPAVTSPSPPQPTVPSPEPLPAPAIPLLGTNNGLLEGSDEAESTKVTTLTREYLVEPSITRLNRMLNYGNSNNNTFSLRNLPDYSALKWGSGPLAPKDGNARYLCFNDKPLRVWLIGELRSFKTKDYKTPPYIYNANRVNVGVRPFHQLDRDLARKTLRFFAEPGGYEGNPAPPTAPDGAANADDILWAGKWMADFGVDPNDIPAFTNCFDGTTKWVGAKNAGHLKIAPNTVRGPDVVLVEAGIKRRFVTKKSDGKYNTDFNQWTLDFELRHVALLVKAPQPEAQFEDDAVDFEV